MDLDESNKRETSVSGPWEMYAEISRIDPVYYA